jgi:hypothetical protein
MAGEEHFIGKRRASHGRRRKRKTALGIDVELTGEVAGTRPGVEAEKNPGVVIADEK